MAYNPSFPGSGHQQGFSGSPGFPQPGSHGHAGAQPQMGGARNIDTNLNYEGASFHIAYRDNNSLLSVRLPPDYELKAKSGSMVAMDASVKIRGKLKVRSVSSSC